MPRTSNRLYRRPNSRFWWAAYTDPTGASHRQSTGCTDRGAAEAWLAARQLERVRAQAGLPVATRIALPDAAAEYLSEHAPPVWAEKWWQTAEGFFRLQVVPAFGERPVSAVTEADAARFRSDQLQRTIRGGRVVSPSSVNRVMWMLAAFGAWCVRRHYHTINPWKMASLPETQAPPPTVDDSTISRILLSLSARWRPVVEVALATGMRKGELSRLRWDDVRGDRLWVVSSHARGLTKGRRTRSVLLTERARSVLNSLPRRDDGFVFGPVGDPRRAFRRAAEAAGLERVWMHLFRHLAASRLADTGASPAQLQRFGGWSAARMAEHYTHVSDDRLRDLMERASFDSGTDPRGAKQKPQ